MNRFLRLREFLARHPTLRDVLLWALPAMIFGTVLRVLLTSCLPYAFWGADSRSYFSFAHRLLADHVFSLDEKRRYLYPILLVPVAALPGPPLRWLAVLQHALGVATIWPAAYVVRKCFVCWRLWIIPVTVLFTALPILLWYEHELLGENLFFASLMWAFAGWVAFVHPSTTPAPVDPFLVVLRSFRRVHFHQARRALCLAGHSGGPGGAGRVAPTQPQADRRAARAGLCDPDASVPGSKALGCSIPPPSR